MDTFGKYATYYDLLYRDKDYMAETEYLDSLIRKFRPDARTILDLGCGTGRHCHLLAGKGYQVHGVDRSNSMINMAIQGGDNANPLFSSGDIRNVRLNQFYDAIVSLFHVMSYQTTDDDILSSFRTVRDHLTVGGVFIFDCWYGPAVLSDLPSVRVKRLEDERTKIVRIAEPDLRVNNNVVAVDYQVYVIDKATGALEVINETHVMRYFFRTEIELFLGMAGLKLLDNFEFMTGKVLGRTTWNACFVVEKIS